MDSKFIKLAFAVEKIGEKEAAYKVTNKQLGAILDKLDLVMTKAEKFDSQDGILSAIKSTFYIRKCSRLLKEADELFTIADMEFTEWRAAIAEL